MKNQEWDIENAEAEPIDLSENTKEIDNNKIDGRKYQLEYNAAGNVVKKSYCDRGDAGFDLYFSPVKDIFKKKKIEVRRVPDTFHEDIDSKPTSNTAIATKENSSCATAPQFALENDRYTSEPVTKKRKIGN